MDYILLMLKISSLQSILILLRITGSQFFTSSCLYSLFGIQKIFQFPTTVPESEKYFPPLTFGLLSVIYPKFLVNCQSHYELLTGQDSSSKSNIHVKMTKNSSGQLPSTTNIEWRPEHQAVLKELIGHITSPPTMAYPDLNLPYIVHTDASEKGLGAVFYQQQGGQMRV